ncbi:MAG: SPFH domain-containing protein, partial [Schleiferiaceae bacterium]|nr:SPFH domain-containing protein [Schleiferiaceae bacterium]
MNIKSIIFALSAVVLTSCVVVSPGTVGVKNKLGKLSNKVIQPGIVGVNPLITRVITVPTRTVNLEVPLYLPSKEGLNVLAEISILYHIEAI